MDQEELFTVVLKTEDILSSVDIAIKKWQSRVNNPKYKFEALGHVSALKKIHSEVQSCLSNVKQHAASFVRCQQKINELRRVGIFFVSNGKIAQECLSGLSKMFELPEQDILKILDAKINSEENQMQRKRNEKVFGIDLGTTYSCISFVDEFGKPVVVPNQDSSPVTPSVVAFEEGGNVSVGQTAKETLNTDPANVCSAIKRQMGKRDYTFTAFGQDYSPEAISAMILSKLAKDAGEVLGEEVKDVVITCPAYFGMDEREATKQAGIIAGLNVLAIINEPTAAVISYGLSLDIPQSVMVYDLGGGTFDVTIIQVANGEIRVVATGGDHQLGGKDWDDAIREFVIGKYAEMTGESSDSIYDDMEVMGDLELRAETAKKQLTQKNSAVIRLNGQKIEITKEEFDQLTTHLLEMTIELMRQTIDVAAAKGVTTIDRILFVGGSTFMPQVRERLRIEFPNIPFECCDPNQVVAKGAAIYGYNLAKERNKVDLSSVKII